MYQFHSFVCKFINKYYKGTLRLCYNSFMKLTVGKLANIFKLSPEAIRFYEKNGLIKSERDSINNYRVFHNIDVQTLASIKRYRNMDFSIGEIKKVHTDIKTSELVSIYDHKIANYYKEHLEKQAIIDKMFANKNIITNIDIHLYNPLIITDVDFYVLPYLLDESVAMTDVINKAPLASPSTYIHNGETSLSFLVEETDIRFFKPHIDSFKLVHMDKCLKVVFRLINESFDYDKQLSLFEKYINQNNIKLKSQAITKLLLNHMHEGKYYHYGILFIEIE